LFFVLRSAFWIVVMSFLLNGGRNADWANIVPSSARQSAANVVLAVGTFHGFCNEHKTACDVTADVLDFARNQAAAAATYVGEILDRSREKNG
jgi:hypothetical protein